MKIDTYWLDTSDDSAVHLGDCVLRMSARLTTLRSLLHYEIRFCVAPTLPLVQQQVPPAAQEDGRHYSRRQGNRVFRPIDQSVNTPENQGVNFQLEPSVG